MRETGRRPWGYLVCLVALVAALACAGGPIAGDAPERPAGPESPAQTADGSMSVEEFQQDIGDAVGAAERYWGEVFKQSGERFEPVSRVVTYQRDGEVSCGGQGIPGNNAVYCSERDFIAYDVNWAVVAFRKVGDAFLYYLLGHEYAHGIQVRLGIRYDYTIQQELQADCMAGAFIGDSVKSKALGLDNGDLDELRSGLLAVADDPGQPWFAEGAHGTAEQRTEAFFNGYERSLSACGLG